MESVNSVTIDFLTALEAFKQRARQEALEITKKLHEANAAALRAEPSGTTLAHAAVRSTTPSMENVLIIPSIKVRMPIVTGNDGKRALLKGAWHIPGTSTFDRGGNSVVSCHRYLYTKGPLTCFHLDKLKEKDDIIVQWNGNQYHYKVRLGRVVTPKEVSILNNTREPILTIFTCTPVFTSTNRLYYIADLVATTPAATTTLR